MSRTADDQAAATDGRVRALRCRRTSGAPASSTPRCRCCSRPAPRSRPARSPRPPASPRDDLRVFADKDALYAAVADRVFDPEATLDAVEAIDLDQPLEGRLADAVEILQRRRDVVAVHDRRRHDQATGAPPAQEGS
ncbi:MAG: hypothetical protein R2690_08090 [Acidimicrobiales bacterium]